MTGQETKDGLTDTTDSGPEVATNLPTALEPDASTKWHGSRPFEVGYATHLGQVRGRNEDSVLVLSLDLVGEVTELTFGLFLVADGMGGHSEGHRASQLAGRIVAKEVMHRLYGPFLQIDAAETPAPVLTILTESLQSANWRINQGNPESGTTLTAGLVVGNRLYVAHVGDSRAYLLSDDQHHLELLTLDHSFVQRLQDSGQISPDEALMHPQRNILYRAVGQGKRLEIDTFSRIIPRPGWLLLCSDGLWGVVNDESLMSTIVTVQKPQRICDELVNAALDAGAPDNVSVIVVRFPGLPPHSTQPARVKAGR